MNLTDEEKRREKKKKMEGMVLQMNEIFPDANFQDLIKSVLETKGKSLDEAMNYFLNNFLREKENVNKEEEIKKDVNYEKVIKKDEKKEKVKKEELIEDDSFLQSPEKKNEEKEENLGQLELIIEKQYKQILELSSTLNLPVSICGVLLRNFKWKEEK